MIIKGEGGRWSIQACGDIKSLLWLINGRIRMQYRLDQIQKYWSDSVIGAPFSSFQQVVNISPMHENYWLTGFLEGDACFRLDIKSDGSNFNPSVKFNIALQGESVLKQVKE